MCAIKKSWKTALQRLLLICAIPIFPVQYSTAGEVQVHVLRVGDVGSGFGQGQSVFVLGPDGTSVLIDAGNFGDGTQIVLPYLASLGISSLDFTFLSHWHTDHLGGMDEVFNGGLRPQVAYDRGDFARPANNQTSQYLNAVVGIRSTPSAGDVFALGDGAVIEVVSVNGATTSGSVSLSGNENQFENASSIALVVRYGDFDLYIGGDVTAGGLGTPNVESLAALSAGQVEVVVASHHGSATSSSSTVVGRLDPSLVLFSCGQDNPFGHPADDTVLNWTTPSATRVLWSTTEGDTNSAGGNPEAGGFTSAEGHVVVSSDGKTFTASIAALGEQIKFATEENPGTLAGPGSIVVSELLIDPVSASDTYGEWFELVNTAPEPRDLKGLKIVSGASSAVLRARILLSQGERVVVGLDGKPYRNGALFVNLSPQLGSLALSNTGGSLALDAPSGVRIDSVTWGAGALAVSPGVSAERIDLLGGASATNFASARTAWAGADLGTPGVVNSVDGTTWSAGLYSPDPSIGGTANFYLASLSEPLNFYFLGVSLGLLLPGFQALGFFIPLQPDALFRLMASNPQFFNGLDVSGRRTVSVPVPLDPSLVGVTVFSNFVTLDVFPVLVGKSQSNLSTLTILP